jgi:nifR3 family TIM-barrel protein
MKIGPHVLEGNLCLSPLAGYTNLPMRLTVRALGGLAWATTDLVNARSLIERNPKALQLTATAPGDQPLSVQLFGSDPGEMREAARIVESLGVQGVDINMGCPVRKVTAIGGGASMMTELAKTQALVKGMVDAVRIPVTAKMRLGWDEDNLTAPDLARALQDVGVAAIFVHGRTRAQGFSGRVNLAGIRAVVESVSIPVIGNGDVTTPEAAAHMIRETGCAGVSIGRGAFYDPWIFRRTRHFLDTGELLPEAGFEERVAVMLGHFERYVDFWGEERGAVYFRRVAPWYARRFGPAKPFKTRVITIKSRSDFQECLDTYRAWRRQFCGSDGELLPKYALPPMTASFLEEEGSGEDSAIKVPKGPVEVW